MNRTRKVLCFVMALMIAAFALPGNAAAPTKKFSVAMFPNLISPGNVALTATIKNETPNGNSSIDSLTLTLPTGYTVDPLNPPTANWSGQITSTSGSVSMSNMTPLKPLQSFDLTLHVKVDATATCAVSVWNASAWTGSSFSGDSFTQVFSPPATQFPVNSTTTVTTGQATAFTTQPTNTTTGTAIPVTVALTTACGSGPAGATVTITVPGCTVASGCLSGNTATTDGNGIATFTALKINTFGTYQLTATTPGFPPATSQTFTVFEGVLSCGDPFMTNFANPGNVAADQPGNAAGSRGKYNKDGVSLECVPVAYTFTNNILTAPFDQVNLSWDTVSQPNAAFIYTMNWRLRSVETTNPLAGWTIAPRPTVAWLADGSGNPIFVPGLACLSGKLPAPYGALGAAVDAGATSITITGVAANPSTGAPAVPPTPFPIVIPNAANPIQTERMTATSLISQSPATAAGYTGTYSLTYNVTRGTPTEGMSTPAAHAMGGLVVSTPLPIIPADSTSFPAPYTPQTQAHMCIAEHGWNSFSIDANGNTQLMYFTTVIDIGDGWVKIN